MLKFQTLRLMGGRKESLINLAFNYVPMGCPEVEIGMDNLDRVPELEIEKSKRDLPVVYCKSYHDNNPVCILCPLSQGIEFNDTNSN